MKGEARVVRIGLVGAGYVSKYHIQALKRLDFAEIVGIADRNRELARAVAERHGIPYACERLEELAAAAPEAVYILTPPSTHCELALEAIERGWHVLVEKPMAATSEECDRMIAKARAAGVVLSVNHSARLDPIVREALARVRAGACGELLSVDFIRSSAYAPYAGGPMSEIYGQGSYPFRDLGVHGLYLLEAFLGPIEQLEADYRGTGRDPNLAFDEWYATARCRKGVGRIYLSLNVRPMQNRLVIHGTGGVLQADCFLQVCTVARQRPGPKFPHMIASAAANSAYTIGALTRNVVRFATGRLPASPGIQAGAAEFARSLYLGQAPPVSAEEGRRAVAWMEEVCRRADGERERQRQEGLKALAPVRVLVTGATGLLGGALLRRLRAAGEPVRALVRRKAPELKEDAGIQVVVGDLGDPEIVDHAVAGVETVYHVGAATRGGREHYEAGTIWGTRNVIEACLRHGVRRLVYVSSLSVLDHAGHRAGAPVTESAPLEPYAERRGYYTQSKLAAERMVAEAVERRGLPAVILRPGQIFGPGAERTAPSGAIALGGRWIVAGGGRRRLPLVYVEDVAEALMLAAEAELAPGTVLHIVDEEPVTQREYIEACRRRLGGAIRVWWAPEWVLLVMAAGVELVGALLKRNLPLSRYRVRSLRPLGVVDARAAREKLGWKPRVGVREGLARTFGPGVPGAIPAG